MRDWRNVVIGALVIAVASLAMLLLRDHLPRSGAPAAARRGEPISVIDLVLDRDSMNALDVIFDKPLGESRVGQVLGRDPATIEPKVGGSWRWQSGNVLRFEAPQRFQMATEYRIALRPERLLEKGQFFDGKTRFVVKTDQFRVEGVDVTEEPAPEGEGKVVLRGDLQSCVDAIPRVWANGGFEQVRLETPVPVAVLPEGEKPRDPSAGVASVVCERGREPFFIGRHQHLRHGHVCARHLRRPDAAHPPDAQRRRIEFSEIEIEPILVRFAAAKPRGVHAPRASFNASAQDPGSTV